MIRSDTINIYKFHNVEEIIDKSINILKNKFDENITYITMANPLDTTYPEVVETIVYEFEDTVDSGIVLPTQALKMITSGKQMTSHNFTVPDDFRHTLIRIDLENLNSENVEALGDKISFMVKDPNGETIAYGSSAGGLPERNHEGSIIKDRLTYEVSIFNLSGEFKINVFGQWFARTEGSYKITITLKHTENSIIPLMPGLSSFAPYLTAYHKGLLFAKTDFAFAADENILIDGVVCNGVSQPGTNYDLIESSNEHTMGIHSELNEILFKITSDVVEQDNLSQLREYFKESPINIAIAADPTMIPMYFYYNPDGRPDSPGADILGFSLPSDFLYGDIDPKPDDPENNTFSYWPFQENIIARTTGKDVQDMSAVIARTIYYYNIINNMGDWKNNALVQTGCGLEFQNLPIATRLSQILYQGRGEPTKAPTGESTFINFRLQEDMATGGFNVNYSVGLKSQREGFSDEDLQKIKEAGLLNKLIFPSKFIKFLNGVDKVTGAQDQLNSNLIFAFAHGFYNIYEAGDVLIDARGFPFVTAISRIYPVIRSSLSSKGTFDIRSIENMEYGPSVIYIESCITARTDGLLSENTLSQTYLHSGANAYIGATRVTADPGYLEPRPLPGGWGIGLLGLINATLNLKLRGEYPDLHFGAVIAEDFILELNENNATTGLALRNAKNMYLEKDANSTFLWTPPLSLSTGSSIIDSEIESKNQPTGLLNNDRTRTLDKKYVALHEFALYGDPAFNPYQPINNG